MVKAHDNFPAERQLEGRPRKTGTINVTVCYWTVYCCWASLI